MIIEFHISCIPPKSTHQAGLRIIQRKDGTRFVGKFATGKAKRAQQGLLALIAPFSPKTPLDGPLALRVQWYYPFRKSEPQKNREKGFLHCDTRPDCDNICKGLCDILTQLGFWYDDAQIAELIFRKYWAAEPGISVEIRQIESGDASQ